MKGRNASLLLAAVCVVSGVAVAWSLLARQSNATADEITTGTLAQADAQTVGPSGLPLPRFVSLKAGKVNVRRGPSSDHQVAWIFQRKGLPVEIVAESDNWRRVRDSEGAEGWVLQNMLSGKRTALIAPWRKQDAIPMYRGEKAGGGLVAKLQAGVVASVDNCTGEWCEVDAAGYQGWIEQSMLWGVYPEEKVPN